MYVLQEIVDDTGDGYIVNVQLIPLYKKQQEVKRAFKLGKLYLVCTHSPGFTVKESPANTGRAKISNKRQAAS
jgi:hypothetical protein